MMSCARAYTGEVRTACPVCSQPIEDAAHEPPNHFRCLRCQLIYRRAKPRISPQEGWDKSYYSDDAIMGFYHKRSSGFAKMVSIVNSYVASRGKWLDVGCGPGVLLQVAHDQGWQVSGIEPSRICFNEVRKRMKYADIVYGTVEAELSKFRDITVASFVGVLASLERPGAVLTNLRDVLVNEGWVLVRETNAATSRKTRAKEIANVKVTTTRLLQEWTPESLETALRLTGFRNVHSIPAPPFVETSGNESNGDAGLKEELKKLLKQGLWPASRLVHSLSAGRLFLAPNFITLGQK
jgi:2-polyprenyl-3-methyl-5-hydroxy-6-metoxy-1,4-benzoquinol methylase